MYVNSICQHRDMASDQHGSLGNVTRLRFLLRYWLHVFTVCCHGGVGCGGVHRDHLDALVLEELHHMSCLRV